jgi:hypothetical protein
MEHEMDGHAASMRNVRKAHKILFRIPKEVGPLRTPRYGWEDNIKMYLERFSALQCILDLSSLE